MTPYLAQTMAFLESIGILCWRHRGAGGFLDRVRIVDGQIYFDDDAAVEDLLHEAGHVAVVPKPYRKFATDDLEVVTRLMGKAMEDDLCQVDSRLMRAMMQSGEAEATAWAWAAGKHLGIPAELIISDGSYNGEGAAIRLQLQMRAYVGINGLWHAEMCARPHQKELPQYPALLHWTQDIGLDEGDLVSPYAKLVTQHDRARPAA